VTRFTEGFNRFVTSTIALVASGWSGCRVGLATTENATSRRTPIRGIRAAPNRAIATAGSRMPNLQASMTSTI